MQAAESLLFGTLADTIHVEVEKRERVMSDHMHVLQSQFNNQAQIVNEYEVKSTLSSEDERSEDQVHQEQDSKFEILERILSM
jgi:hypothetical protein